ncbi:MAG TPA: hypothetical protein PKD51_10040 [Saprospiraceae bacterium]|nr:hypothetical protein [Saprospiraceae bacterium]
MYLHHTPTTTDGFLAASSIIHASDINVDNGELVAISTFKRRDVAAGDSLMHKKVLYIVSLVQQHTKRTQIVAREAK